MKPDNFFSISNNIAKSAKILIANFPGDGHFNPMTGIAIHLKQQGYDVRWYTSKTYQQKIESFDIPFYPLQKAVDISDGDVTKIFPGREKYKSQVARLNFDIINVFVNRGPEYFEDIKEVYNSFPFELMIADVAFTGIPFVTDLMRIPVIGVGIFPITKNSRDLPPAGLGMSPSYNFFGKMKQNLLRFVAKHILFTKSNKVMKEVLEGYGIDCKADSVFDLMPSKCSLVFQTGTPGFEYQRSDLDPKYKFVGPLLPYSSKKTIAKWYNEKLSMYKKIVLVTQGTVEKDGSKLLMPTLEALKETDYLVVVTTGGSDTEKLRNQYNSPNIIIEDFIPFADIMPYADVYVTNGGMGGVQISIQNNLPMITAGVHEGKNEICARVGYFNLGINLKTERPTPEQIRKAVEQIIANDSYRRNIEALSKEFRQYHPSELCEKYVQQLLPVIKKSNRIMEEAIY